MEFLGQPRNWQRTGYELVYLLQRSRLPPLSEKDKQSSGVFRVSCKMGSLGDFENMDLRRKIRDHVFPCWRYVWMVINTCLDGNKYLQEI